MLVFEDTVVPAASLWAGARCWLDMFRTSGVRPGDRLVLGVEPSPAFLQVLIAGLWEGLTLALVDPKCDVSAFMDEFDAVAAVSDQAGRFHFVADRSGAPAAAAARLRTAAQPPLADVRLLTASSGTSKAPRWAALSDVNVLSVLTSHLSLLDMESTTVLSMLPWRHPFGLVIDLLPALLSRCVIVRDAAGGRDVSHLTDLSEIWNVDYCSMVPLVAERLSSSEKGRALLMKLRGGVVGGAPVSSELAAMLRQTRLRAGYGQTEASPGIALGKPGIWDAGEMGSPVGCSVQLDEHGSLFFRGRNACCGFWESGSFRRADPSRLVDTGDVANRVGDRLIFCGRKSDEFKLSNGTWIQPRPLETRLLARFAGLVQAMVYASPAGRIALAVERKAPNLPDDSTLVAAMGTLGSWIDRIDEVGESDWMRTPKGDLDRPRIARRLAELKCERNTTRWSN